MTTTDPTAAAIMDGVKVMYESWAAQMAAVDDPPPEPLPSWDELPPEALTAWMAAYAATVEVSHRMATAVVKTVEAWVS